MKFINLVLLLIAIISIWVIPSYAYVLLILSLFISLAFSTHTIFRKHKGTENARKKILKEAGMLVLTLITVLFLAGIVAMLANYQISMRWGEVAGLVSAIGASFLVGYWVRKGMRRWVG